MLLAGNGIQFLYFRWQKQRAEKLKKALDQAIKVAQKRPKKKKRSSSKAEELAVIMRECFLKSEIEALNYPSDSHNYWNLLRNSLSSLFDTIRDSMTEEGLIESFNPNDFDSAEKLGELKAKLEHYRGRIDTLEGFRTLFVEMELKYNELPEKYQESIENVKQQAPDNSHFESFIKTETVVVQDHAQEASLEQQLRVYKNRLDEMRKKLSAADKYLEDLDLLRNTVCEDAQNSQQMLIAIEMLEK